MSKELELQNKELQQQVEDLTAELQAQEARTRVDLPVITVDKKKYQLQRGDFFFKKDGKDSKMERFTAEDLKKDKDLAKQLVKRGTGILQKL